MAGRASLTFLGQEDVVLSGDPEVTYFVERYVGHTPFARHIDKIEFDGPAPTYSGERSVVIPRSADILSHLELKLEPSLAVGMGALDSAGTLMIDYVVLYIGSTVIERLSGEFIEMMMDLKVPLSKQAALETLTGKGQTTLLGTYTVPLPFSCLEKGLPLCAFQEDLTLTVGFTPSTQFTDPPVSTASPFKASLNAEYTYLTQSEVAFIRATPQLKLFEQVQRRDFFVLQGVTNPVCPLGFTNAVKELFIVIRNDTARGYDYSNVTGGTTDQLSNLVMFFSSTERISADVGTPLFLRNVQALEFHTRIPDRLFYMYSFSLDPQSDAPCGHVNFARISNQSMKFGLSPSTTNRYITVYAVSYNFLQIEGGHATVLFSP